MAEMEAITQETVVAAVDLEALVVDGDPVVVMETVVAVDHQALVETAKVVMVEMAVLEVDPVDLLDRL